MHCFKEINHPLSEKVTSYLFLKINVYDWKNGKIIPQKSIYSFVSFVSLRTKTRPLIQVSNPPKGERIPFNIAHYSPNHEVNLRLSSSLTVDPHHSPSEFSISSRFMMNKAHLKLDYSEEEAFQPVQGSSHEAISHSMSASDREKSFHDDDKIYEI